MEKKLQKSETRSEAQHESTQHSTSRKLGKLLDNSTSGEIQEGEVEQWDWEPIEGTPFYAVGKEGEYTLVLCGMAVAKEKFKTVEEASKYVKKKAWDLILLASCIYREAFKTANDQKKGM